MNPFDYHRESNKCEVVAMNRVFALSVFPHSTPSALIELGMPAVEQTSSKSWLHDDKDYILLATLTAIALAAGSTVLWRARRTTTAAEHIDAHSSEGFHSSPGENHREGEEMNIQPGNATQ